MKYYVYVDWTLESHPRPFYVGKGSGNRATCKRRNWKHRQVRIEFGLKRMIVFESENESDVLQREVDLIAQYKTFISDLNYNGIGANFTGGGEGGSHPSDHTRILIAESNRRRKGEKRSESARQHIRNAIRESIARRGTWSLTEEHKQRISESNKGHNVSKLTRQKLSETSKNMHQDPIVKEKILHALRAKIAIRVAEIDPTTNCVIEEHPTMNLASRSAKLTVKYLRIALRNDDQEYLVKRTGRKWKIVND